MLRKTDKGRWEKVEDKIFAKKVELQHLLIENPDLIPVELVGADRKPISVEVHPPVPCGGGAVINVPSRSAHSRGSLDGRWTRRGRRLMHVKGRPSSSRPGECCSCA